MPSGWIPGLAAHQDQARGQPACSDDSTFRSASTPGAARRAAACSRTGPCPRRAFSSCPPWRTGGPGRG